MRIWRSYWVLATAWWLLYALVYAGQIVGMAQSGAAAGWWPALRLSLGSTLPWIPITVALGWLAERWPIERSRVLRRVALHGAAVALVVVARAAWVEVANPWIGWYAEAPPFGQLLAISLQGNMMMTWLVVGTVHALAHAARVRATRMHVVELEARLAQARLEALSARLNPHFLFNALNSIAELVHHDADGADRMLVGLSALLRRSLSGAAAHTVALRDDVALARHYLDIERLRLGDRLRVAWDVDPTVLDAEIPLLLLQPLVENAVLHAIAPRAAPGSLRISARAAGARLEVEVVDDGEAPRERGPSRGHGLGLKATAERLACLYGDDASVAFEAGAQGARVSIRLPLRWAADAQVAGGGLWPRAA